jgi:CRISPR-associated endonuclease/helicase Cas3
MSKTIGVQLLSHSEKIAPENPFPKAVASLLYHQWRTYYALQNHSLVVNTYNTGTGKTRAALMHLLDPKSHGENMLFIAPTNELIAQHTKDIREFIEKVGLEYHVIPVDAKELRSLPTQHDHERVGERLNRLIQNPREYGFEGQKPIILVTNPDIFYYVLYFSAYNPHDRRNLFEQFLTRFDYVVIDEFHYYSPKQLATFLFYFVISKQWGYINNERKICLLSATPEPEILAYLKRVFGPHDMELISPHNEPPDADTLSTICTLAPIDLELERGTIAEYVQQAQPRLTDWINQGSDGALISSALWQVNLAYSALLPSLAGKIARITGAEKTKQRRKAPSYPLILATPTVDIGYNFDKPGKTRQPIDFVIFDAHTRDQFLQRLGRAGRVLGHPQTNITSYAVALLNVNDNCWAELDTLDNKTFERRIFVKTIQEIVPPRRDFYSYMQSYGMLEVLRPLFNLKKMLRPDLLEWLEKLFDGICDVFVPDNSRWRFTSIECEMRKFENLEKIVRGDNEKDKLLIEFLPEYLDWQKAQITKEEYLRLAKKLSISESAKRQVFTWVEEQYWLKEKIFSFRDAFETPSACVFDPNHLLADSEVTVYDALHVVSNFEVEWFSGKDDFFTKTGTQPDDALVFARLLSHRSPRLRFVFEYNAPDRIQRERFEELYCRRPVALKGLQIRAEFMDGRGTFPIDAQMRTSFEDSFVPLLLVQDRSLASGLMRSHLRDTNIFLHTFKTFFADGSENDYLAVLGSAAFTVHAEMEKIFWAVERKEDSKPIIT